MAVIAPDSLVDDVAVALEAAGIPYGRATRHGLDKQVTVVPVRLVKGLELDAADRGRAGEPSSRRRPRGCGRCTSP